MNFAPSGGARSAPIDPPERELTPAAMIARATALRAALRDAQAECEAQGRGSDHVNAELIRAGWMLGQKRRPAVGINANHAQVKVFVERHRICGRKYEP